MTPSPPGSSADAAGAVPSGRRSHRPLPVRIVQAAVPAALLATVALAAAAADPAAWKLERGDGGVTEGGLVRVDREGVVVATAGAEARLPIAEVRSLERLVPAADAPRAVRLMLVDGGWIDGDDVAWDGAKMTLVRPEGTVGLPAERVRTVAWRHRTDAPGGAPGAGWLGSLPEAAESDLLVVAAADGQEFVECAIKGVSAETVTVVLDEETIPVKRAKVVGLHWVRPEAPPRRAGGVAVTLDGGSLRGGGVEWSAEGLVLDGDMRLPQGIVARFDWAAGRTVSLVTLAPERLEVEPWFGGLAKVPGLAAHFGPRPVEAGGGFARGGLVVRPRTTMVWRVPAESRRFRATAAPAAGELAAGAVVLSVAVDDEERLRHRIDATTTLPDGVPIDVDVTGGRRLSITVDFVGGGDGGCAVRLGAPVIEQ